MVDDGFRATNQTFNVPAGGRFGQGRQRVGRREGLQVASRAQVSQLGRDSGARAGERFPGVEGAKVESPRFDETIHITRSWPRYQHGDDAQYDEL